MISACSEEEVCIADSEAEGPNGKGGEDCSESEVDSLSGLVTPTKSPRQISKHAAKDAMLESEFFKDLEAH